MRRLVLLLLVVALACAPAQAPKIGDINCYGLHHLTAGRLLKAVGLETGAELPPSKGDLEEKLEAVPGVVAARVEVACCDGTSAILFIGIEERGGPHFETRAAPAGNAVLPEDLVKDYHEFLDAVERAARAGTAAEDYTTGEPRMADPAARGLQDRFAQFAAANLELLRDVLRNGSEADQRAVAASVIGYAPAKDRVLNDLQYALQDADESARGNAVRSLKAIAVLAQKRPELGLKVAPTWLVAMLNSIVLGDREQAAEALVILTDQPNPAALDLMRERALSALIEMARWKTLRYALPAFLLVGRIAGIPDSQLHAQWQKGDRETAIKQASSPKRPSAPMKAPR
jgi:hypothetical protein